MFSEYVTVLRCKWVCFWVHESCVFSFFNMFPRVPRMRLHCIAFFCVYVFYRCVVCVSVLTWDKKKMRRRSQGFFLLRSVPICSPRPNCSWCEDRKRERSDCTHPLPWVISVIWKERCQNAPDYCHVNNGTWRRSLLMNVIYFSKRGLIIDQGPLSPPTGSQSQLAAGDGC